MTHRQYLAWEAWLAFGNPTRADYYAMKIAQTMGGGTLSKYRVKFESPKTNTPQNIEETARRAKQAALARLGMKIPGMEDVEPTIEDCIAPPRKERRSNQPVGREEE